MLFLQCCLWQLSLQDEAPLLINVTLHAGKSMGPNERQICLQTLFIWSICSRNKDGIKCLGCVQNSSAADELVHFPVKQQSLCYRLRQNPQGTMMWLWYLPSTIGRSEHVIEDYFLKMLVCLETNWEVLVISSQQRVYSPKKQVLERVTSALHPTWALQSSYLSRGEKSAPEWEMLQLYSIRSCTVERAHFLYHWHFWTNTAMIWV